MSQLISAELIGLSYLRKQQRNFWRALTCQRIEPCYLRLSLQKSTLHLHYLNTLTLSESQIQKRSEYKYKMTYLNPGCRQGNSVRWMTRTWIQHIGLVFWLGMLLVALRSLVGCSCVWFLLPTMEVILSSMLALAVERLCRSLSISCLMTLWIMVFLWQSCLWSGSRLCR